jgi:hypothetical protein
VGKRNFDEAVSIDGAVPTGQVKKGRLDAEVSSILAWAEAGHQPC